MLRFPLSVDLATGKTTRLQPGDTLHPAALGTGVADQTKVLNGNGEWVPIPPPEGIPLVIPASSNGQRAFSIIDAMPAGNIPVGFRWTVRVSHQTGGLGKARITDILAVYRGHGAPTCTVPAAVGDPLKVSFSLTVEQGALTLTAASLEPFPLDVSLSRIKL